MCLHIVGLACLADIVMHCAVGNFSSRYFSDDDDDDDDDDVRDCKVQSL